MSEDSLGVQLGEGLRLASMGGGQGATKHPAMQRTTSLTQQRIN